MSNNGASIKKWISILYRHGQSYISKKLEPYNVGSGQLIFLLALYKKNEISQEELSDYLKIDKATTAKAIKELENEGYVNRNPDANDKRAYKVFLTPKALEIKPVIEEAIHNWNNVLTSGLTDQEINQFEELLQKTAENACHLKKAARKIENEGN